MYKKLKVDILWLRLTLQLVISVNKFSQYTHSSVISISENPYVPVIFASAWVKNGIKTTPTMRNFRSILRAVISQILDFDTSFDGDASFS